MSGAAKTSVASTQQTMSRSANESQRHITEHSGQAGIGPGADGRYQPCRAECGLNVAVLLSRPDNTIKRHGPEVRDMALCDLVSGARQPRLCGVRLSGLEGLADGA